VGVWRAKELPGCAWNEPEVYETSDMPKGDQAELEAVRLSQGCATGQGQWRWRSSWHSWKPQCSASPSAR
uniref:Uncharacterized protein n=1 Tax=Cairina moschata TaxID=8855 RepID=A0A8C3CJ03_CAIMO